MKQKSRTNSIDVKYGWPFARHPVGVMEDVLSFPSKGYNGVLSIGRFHSIFLVVTFSTSTMARHSPRLTTCVRNNNSKLNKCSRMVLLI